MSPLVYSTDLRSLREQLHAMDSVLLEAPLWRVGTKWWTRSWQERHALRAMITQAAKGERTFR
jgi:hypothetical protein